MLAKDGLIIAFILDGNGGGKLVTWEDIRQWEPTQGTLWLHLNYTSPKAKQWLKKESGLDALVVKALTREETRPRAVIEQQHLLLFLRGVNLNPGQDPEDMVSIRTYIEKHRIITTRRRRLLSIDDIRQALLEGKGPRTPADFIVKLNDRLTNRMSEVIDRIDEEVDNLEEEMIEAESHLLRPKISEVRRQAICMRRYLSPQREALYQLQTEDAVFFDKQQLIAIRETTDRVIRFIEDLDTARDRASIAQEELSSRLSEQLDKRMFVLSLVAVIFLPLSFVTGLLGVNLGGIPGNESSYGFAIVTGVLAFMGAGLWWWFKHKKWM